MGPPPTRYEVHLDMVRRAIVVWFAMLAAASVNGGIREAVLIPRWGDLAGRAASTISLSGLVLLLTCVTIAWIRPRSSGEAWTVGALWVGLTLAFEFLAGHYLFDEPWPRLLEDYDLSRGRIWVLVLVTTAVAPRICAQARGVLARDGSRLT
jgi:hypothetical protein